MLRVIKFHPERMCDQKSTFAKDDLHDKGKCRICRKEFRIGESILENSWFETFQVFTYYCAGCGITQMVEPRIKQLNAFLEELRRKVEED